MSSSGSGGRIGRGGNPPVFVAGAGQAGGAGGQPSVECDAASLAGLAVFSPSWDALGYPPYALEGCTLLYVAPADQGGALHLRDLATGDDEELAGPSEHPRRPTIAGGVVAWERDDPSGSAVSVMVREPARSKELTGAAEPRATTNGVVFTKLLGADPHDDMDIGFYDVDADDVVTIAEGPGQQRFADVDATTIAYTDFSEDPLGYFDEAASLADVVVVDRATGKKTARARAGKQAFPLLGANGGIAYLDWGAVHPEPKFSQFTLMVGRIDEPVTADFNVKGDTPIMTDPAYNRPSLRGVHLDFVDLSSGTAQLYRFALDQPSQLPTAVVMEQPEQLLGPVASDFITLIATRGSGQNLQLRAFGR
jgi:hypothetical protein